MHSQIISGLYTTLIILSPAAYRERKKVEKNKERGIQAIITTPLCLHWEGYEQLTKGPSMTGIPKPNGFGPRRLPSHPSPSQRCTRALATPTQTPAPGSMTR
jgi:hypothetical protein